MTAGIFLFAVNDALGKWLMATYTVGQVLLIRSVAALALLAPFIWRDVATFAQAPRWGLQVLRAVLATVEVACFYWAVAYLSLADVMAFYLAVRFSSPRSRAPCWASRSAGAAGPRWPRASSASGLPAARLTAFTWPGAGRADRQPLRSRCR